MQATNPSALNGLFLPTEPPVLIPTFLKCILPSVRQQCSRSANQLSLFCLPPSVAPRRCKNKANIHEHVEGSAIRACLLSDVPAFCPAPAQTHILPGSLDFQCLLSECLFHWFFASGPQLSFGHSITLSERPVPATPGDMLHHVALLIRALHGLSGLFVTYWWPASCTQCLLCQRESCFPPLLLYPCLARCLAHSRCSIIIC